MNQVPDQVLHQALNRPLNPQRGDASSQHGAATDNCVDVCIVGSGLIAKATAFGLAQKGLSVALVSLDQDSSSQEKNEMKASTGSPAIRDARVYALNQSTKDWLTELKIWPLLDPARITPVLRMQIWGDSRDDHGRNNGSNNRGELEFDAYQAALEALAWIVEDAHLNEILENSLRFMPSLQRYRQTAQALQLTEAAARLELANRQTICAQLIIAADGAQSWVRQAAHIPVSARAYHQQAVVANFACSRPHRHTAFQWFCEEGVFALLPLPGQAVSLVWSAADHIAQSWRAGSANISVLDLSQRLNALPWQPLGELTPLEIATASAPPTVKIFPLQSLRAKTLIGPRVALIGDAAHVIHPLAGQGMNLGFADAQKLIEVIAARDLHHDCGSARVLQRYARARAEPIWKMQFATDGLTQLFNAPFKPLQWLRNQGMHGVNRLPFLKRYLINQAIGK